MSMKPTAHVPIPRISFGMIVLNGEPFILYNLRSLYPWAHQIIVVEGACPTAKEVATRDGHSTDGTYAALRQFQSEEDPENKVIIVTASDDGYISGFWPEKDEMSVAYARRATGQYLWQVDSDEFYHEEQIKKLLGILQTERPDAVSFPTLTFWGATKYQVNSFYLIRDKAREYHRLFAWGPGYSYETHRPPTVLDANGIDTRKKKWLNAKNLEKLGIHLFHYSLLFPHQVSNKISYYKGRVSYPIETWKESVYWRLQRPFRVHNVYKHIGWLERYAGEHPQHIIHMVSDIDTGIIPVTTRDCNDVEALLSNKWYRIATWFLKSFAHLIAWKPCYFVYRIYTGGLFRLNNMMLSMRSNIIGDRGQGG